jgi:predicted permease
MALGQLTFFSIPLLKSIYVNNVSEVLIPASMMTLAFRIALYFYAFISISGTKLSKETVGPTLKKIFLNPIMIMMLLGLIIWLT